MFSKKNKSSQNLITLDINKENTSIIQIDGKKVKSFNSMKTPIGVFSGAKITNADLLQHSIKSLVENTTLSGTDVSLSLSEDNISKHTLEVDADFDDREIINYIRSNTKKISDNINLDEFYLDYYKSNVTKENNKIEIILFLIKKVDVKIYEDSLKILGLDLVNIDLDYLCLERLLNKGSQYNFDNDTIVGYFQINKDNTKLTFFKDGKRIFEYTSEDYNYKSIIESPDDKNSATASESGGIDLDLDAKIEDDEEKNEGLSGAALAFIEFIKYNIVLIDTEGKDCNFKIFTSVNDKFLDFNYSDLTSELDNTEVFTSQPFKNFEISDKIDTELLESLSSRLGVLRGTTIPKENNDISINLFDWRGNLTEGATKKFQTLLGGVAMLAGLAIFAQHFIISTKIKSQQERNNEIKKIVDSDIEKEALIAELKEEKEVIVKKIETINSLQVQRPQIVNLFTSVVKSTPKEVHITKFNRLNTGTIEINGKSTEEKKIFDMIKSLEDSRGFYNVKISQITNADSKTKDKDAINPYYKPEYDFKLTMKETLLGKNNKENN
jgi:type IV pilus assembly protein PilN